MRVLSARSPIALAAAAALGTTAMSTAPTTASAAKTSGTYVAGDFHNHTTCSDGSISMQKLVKKSTDKTDTPWGLDWFVQAGHGGSGNRNCTLAEDASLATPAYSLVFSGSGALQGPTTTWQNTNPPVQPKGLVSGTAPNQNMWRWQSIQEFQYPLLEYLARLRDKPMFVGVESVVAGHEHSSMSVITGQMPLSIDSGNLPTSKGYTALGNATALAQWEYCFDRNDTDTSRGNTAVGSGVGNNWTCAVPGSLNSGDPSWNTTAQKLIPAGGTGTGERGHQKTVEGIRWMAQNHPNASYYVPAHLERAGPFNPNGNNGFNIEHLRNFNNAGPAIAFGFETQPGHGASSDRGEYAVNRNSINGVPVDSVGGTTYGGTGVYGAQIGGVWDALLGEGRNWWFFASSDWHNRGSFGPDDRRTTQDFYPGEYQRTYVMARNGGDPKLRPQTIVDGLRTGNAFAASGQLIDRLGFVACASYPGPAARTNAAVEAIAVAAATRNTDTDVAGCAAMGEKLVVRRGAEIVVSIVVRDPSGTNYAPYTFNNPSLAQVGIQQPLNTPVLDHVDVIRGMVSGYKQPGSADYAGQWPNTWRVNPDLNTVPAAAKNLTAGILRTFNSATWTSVANNPEYKVMTFRVPAVSASQYLRLRGSNLPPSVPWETDANGNPMLDLYTNASDPTQLKIPCSVAGTNVPANGTTYTGTAINGCPNHLQTVNGQKYLSYDVAAWADLWFYSNPIYVEVAGSTIVAGVK
ncbi:hypothetical protein [Piscinibacter koreensis]|uniref:DUF3604 domain-containing protein n=1 Tax=Piscinibacter koreensis TaxID=2742824 RepID=A0A7Y6NTE8_9BURK|nr:hypothetical protein [Schlegelella koreensis]NUZ08857.1 hypothetical protein [Schlegelella koreensis]